MKKGILFLICSLILCVCTNMISSANASELSASASEMPQKTKISQTDKTVSQSQDLNANASNYHYSQSDPEFMYKNINGTIAIENDSIAIGFNTVSIPIPQFDYYKVIEANGNTRFYQADTLLEQNIENPFAFIAIYLPSIFYGFEVHTMIVQYSVADEEILYNIRIPLMNNEICFFDEVSEELVLSDDDLSSRLKDSARILSKGADIDLIQNEPPRKALSYIAPNSYDSYTDTDELLKSYTHFGDRTGDGKITDDPIVGIIPKELCFIPGEHLYIGKEYGFFIKSVFSSGFNNVKHYADIMVFDIFHWAPSFPNNVTGFSKIIPLFQYRYNAASPAHYDWTDYDPTLTSVVHIDEMHFDVAEYYISDVGFKHSLCNPTLLNPGDHGYNAYEDDGAFITQRRYNAQGVGLKKKNKSFLQDTINFGFGFIPYVGTILSVGGYVHDVYNGFGNQGYFFSRETWLDGSGDEANIETNQTNNTDQIDGNDGNLIKSVSTKSIPDSDSPRLINVGGGYAESKYVVARRTGSTYNMLYVVTSVSLNILEDNTSLTFGIQTGSVRNYGRATGTYVTSTQHNNAGDISRDMSVSGYVTKNVDAYSPGQIYRFVPTVSGSYSIRSRRRTTIHNATLNQVSDPAWTHTMNFTAGYIYYIETESSLNEYNGYTVDIGYSLSASAVLPLNTDTFVSVNTGYEMFGFTPANSQNYNIYTSNISGNPYLILFDSTGTMLEYNNYGRGNPDAMICRYLDAGTTYYIAAHGYNGNAATFHIKIVTAYPKLYLDSPAGVVITAPPDPIIYQFTAPTTADYSIYTDFYPEFSNGMNAPPFLYLYDAKNNFIAYDVNGCGYAYHAAIIARLNAGQTYYIHAGTFGPPLTAFKLIVSLY